MANIKQVRALEDIDCINFCQIPQAKPSQGPFKKEIIGWLKSLTIEQLKSVMSFTSPTLVKIILLMIQNNKLLGLHMFMLYPATPEDIDLVKQWSSTFYLRPVEVNFSSSLLIGGKDTKNENMEILLNGIRIIDSIQVYDTLCLSDDLLKNINETLLILDYLTHNKIFESQWFDPCTQDFVTQYIIHGIQKGIETRFKSQNQQLMKQITCDQVFWKTHNMEPKEKGEFTETILNETYNDEYYQLFIKKHPNNQEEFINEVLELFTDQNDIDDILSITIYDYDNLKHFVARRVIDKLFEQQRRPLQLEPQTSQILSKKKDKKKKVSSTSENVAELSKIFTSHNQSEVLPNSKIKKQMQGYLFSTPPNLETPDSPKQDKNLYNEINSCPDYNHKTENADSICEIMQLSHNFTTKCIDEVLKKASQEELELQHIIKDKRKQVKSNKKRNTTADNSDKVSQVTSIDNMSSITALKTSIQQDDSGSSQNWQGGSVSQQGEIDFSIDQQVLTKKQRKKLKLKQRKNQLHIFSYSRNQEKKQKLQSVPIQIEEQKIIEVQDRVADVNIIKGKLYAQKKDNEKLNFVEEQRKIESDIQNKSDDSFIEVESRKKIKRKKQYKSEYKSQASDTASSPYTEKKYTNKQKSQTLTHPKLQDLTPIVLIKQSMSEASSIQKFDHKPKEKLEESKQVEQKGLELEQRQTSSPLPQTLERVKGHQIKLRKKNDILTKSKIQRKDHTLSYKKEDVQIAEQVSNDLFDFRMTQEVITFCYHIKTEFEKYNEARKLVFLRIKSVVRQHFINLGDARQFGSSESGLGLPDSDIDISILGFCNYQIIQAMEELLDILVQYKWVVKFKPIYSALVPILKLEIDPSICFDSYTHPSPPVNFKQKPSLDLESSKIPSRVFQVDITFEALLPPMEYYPRQHVGHSSTEVVMLWKRQYNGFRELSLILKSILKKKGLNDAYKGGISSFCLAVMLAAVYQEQDYIKHNTQSYGNLGMFMMLQQFLYKYGIEFDLSVHTVCLRQSSGFMILDENPSCLSRLTVYSPLTNQVISAGVISAPIFEEFKKIYNNLQDLQKKLSLQIQKYVSPEKLKEISLERSPFKETQRQLPLDVIEDKAFFFNYLL